LILGHPLRIHLALLNKPRAEFRLLVEDAYGGKLGTTYLSRVKYSTYSDSLIIPNLPHWPPKAAADAIPFFLLSLFSLCGWSPDKTFRA
jgi:hypothetical protein